MILHERNDLIYTNLRGKITYEIVVVINTSMETQSGKIWKCQR